MLPLQWKCGVLTTGSRGKPLPCPLSRRVCVCVWVEVCVCMAGVRHTCCKAAGGRDRRRPPQRISGGGGGGDFEFHLQSFAMRGRKKQKEVQRLQSVCGTTEKCPCHQLLFYLGHRHSPTNLEQPFLSGNVACPLYF